VRGCGHTLVGMVIVTERKRQTVLRAAWLLDGTTATRTPDPAVVIDGGTIIAVGTSTTGTVSDSTDVEIVDLPGATLVPGLVDSHVHLVFDASDDPVGHLAGRDDAAAFVAMTRAARLAARGGVTTVRDLGDRGYLSLAIRDAARSDRTLPTVVAAGPPITTLGGHCHYLGGTATGVDGVRATVRAHAERGVDVIKIMASGGGLTPGTHPERPQFSPDELRAAVEEAHRHDLPITAHAHGTPAIADAVAAGVDGLEHVTFMTADGVEPAPEDLVSAIAERRIALGMTLPAPGTPLPPGAAERMPAVLANARRLYRAGARIIAASDAGIAPIVPPDAARHSISALTQTGMPPAEALRACTSRAAAACGLGDRKGRIAPGYDADILAVNGNPLDDPAALHQIHAIYLRGARLGGIP
jgi:imidazolonepropionase-like amidohydrolase